MYLYALYMISNVPSRDEQISWLVEFRHFE